MGVIIGSARIDEKGNITGGAAGDQKQTSTPDYTGEVSMQNFYVHSKGWNVLRAKSSDVALKLASSMITACNNANVGYDQNERLGIIKYGTASKTKTECDCSSLVRQCVIEAAGKDPGNFNTESEAKALMNTGLFNQTSYTSGMTLYTGDILVTKTKGHTVIVTAGAARIVEDTSSSYYPVYAGNTTSIVDALKAIGESDVSYSHREKIAASNSIAGYKGTILQNTQMLNLLKQGKLKRHKGLC